MDRDLKSANRGVRTGGEIRHSSTFQYCNLLDGGSGRLCFGHHFAGRSSDPHERAADTDDLVRADNRALGTAPGEARARA